MGVYLDWLLTNTVISDTIVAEIEIRDVVPAASWIAEVSGIYDFKFTWPEAFPPVKVTRDGVAINWQYTEATHLLRIDTAAIGDSVICVYFVMVFCTTIPPDLPRAFTATITTTQAAGSSTIDVPVIPKLMISSSSNSIGDLFYGTIVSSGPNLSFPNGDKFFNAMFKRCAWRNGIVTIRHGDGGKLLTYAQYQEMGNFIITDKKINDERMSIETESSLGIINKVVPPNKHTYYGANPSVFGNVKPVIYGNFHKFPAVLTTVGDTDNTYFVADGGYDDMSKVYYTIDNGRSWYQLPEIAIVSRDAVNGTFVISRVYLPHDSADNVINNDVAVDVKRCVDINGTFGASYQRMGSFLKHFLKVYAFNNSTALMDVASFATLDSDFICEINVVIGLSGSEKISDVIKRAEQSMVGYIRMTDEGLITTALFDPTAVVDGGSILEYEIMDIGAAGSGQDIYETINVRYLEAPFYRTFQEVSRTDPRARFIYGDEVKTLTFETLLVHPSDADLIAQLYLLLAGQEPIMVSIETPSRYFHVTAGNTIEITRADGFGDGGTYSADNFLVVHAERHFNDSRMNLECRDLFGIDSINAGVWSADAAPNNNFWASDSDTSGTFQWWR